MNRRFRGARGFGHVTAFSNTLGALVSFNSPWSSLNLGSIPAMQIGKNQCQRIGFSVYQQVAALQYLSSQFIILLCVVPPPLVREGFISVGWSGSFPASFAS